MDEFKIYLRSAQALVHARRHKHKVRRMRGRWPARAGARHPADPSLLSGAVVNVAGWDWELIGRGLYSECWARVADNDRVVKISGMSGFGKVYSRTYWDSRACWNPRAEDSRRYDPWQEYAERCTRVQHPNLPKFVHFERASPSIAWAIMPRLVSADEVENERDELRTRAIRIINGRITEDSEVGDVLYNMAQIEGVGEDLHTDNVMYDPASDELVLTDPFYNCGGYAPPTIRSMQC